MPCTIYSTCTCTCTVLFEMWMLPQSGQFSLFCVYICIWMYMYMYMYMTVNLHRDIPFCPSFAPFLPCSVPLSLLPSHMHPQRQQLLVAQEMFKESPSLSREQKALILGFMAGARGQPMYMYVEVYILHAEFSLCTCMYKYLYVEVYCMKRSAYMYMYVEVYCMQRSTINCIRSL